MWRLLWWPLFLPVGSDVPQAGEGEGTASGSPGLPTPSEGQPIPAARQSGWISTPDRRIEEVWTSPTDHAVVFRDPSGSAHLRRLENRLNELAARFPDRAGSARLGKRLNQASRWYPRSIVWLIVGLVAIAVRRPRGLLTPVVLTAAALLLLLATSLAVPATADYSAPVGPAFILFAVAGLFGPSRKARSCTDRTTRTFREFA
jgi:hypothetical protein